MNQILSKVTALRPLLHGVALALVPSYHTNASVVFVLPLNLLKPTRSWLPASHVLTICELPHSDYFVVLLSTPHSARPVGL